MPHSFHYDTIGDMSKILKGKRPLFLALVLAAAFKLWLLVSDATTFNLADGLSWKDPAGRTRTETELGDWMGKRASSGRMAPRGFPSGPTTWCFTRATFPTG